jgi:alpha-L-fucosidase
MSPVPNAKQLEWYHREVMIFFHFNMNTFTGDEWGDGNASPTQFNPTNLDCGQWIRTVKNAGFTCAILTAKHHDGFCLWPSAYTAYDVAASPWKNGGGDVVREFVDACNKYGVKPGIYLSPWDRHESSYGTAAYNTYYANQLKELLTNYGPICEIWWDGAGDQMSFDFKGWADTVKALQPACFIFGAKKASPYVDGRWIGNEDGQASDPCWSTINRSVIDAEDVATLASGQVSGSSFVPAECDVTIRPGWYFHVAENSQVKPVSTLWNTLYFGSVGRNCVLLLNLPPDKRGLIFATDSTRLDSLGGWVRGTFAQNLAAGAAAAALHARGEAFSAAAAIDASETTYYAASDDVRTDTLTFDLGSQKTFDCVMLQEKIELGQRITRWAVDAFVNGAWKDISGTKQSVGYKWLLKFNPVTASQVRLRILQGKGCPAIHTFGVYKSAFGRAAAASARDAPNRRGAGDRPAPNVGFERGRLVLPVSLTKEEMRIQAFSAGGRKLFDVRGKGQYVELPRRFNAPGTIIVLIENGVGGAWTKRTVYK